MPRSLCLQNSPAGPQTLECLRASGFNGSRERRSLHASGFRFGFAFALRKGENYRGRVSLVRAFILVCVCLALFLQSAAQAASAPPETREAIHCSEMDDGMATERSSDKKRSEEHTSELQSLMRISYAVFCLKKKTETDC